MRRFVIESKEYVANYSGSKVYAGEVSEFLKQGEYDEYRIDEKVDFQVFKTTGHLKKMFVYAEELQSSPQILADFTEEGLKNTAISVLVELYGQDIVTYLDDYYHFEYAKLIEYANDEQNRYVVCYRAYLNNQPTDDVLYVQFSLSGALWSVSAQRYLQYLNVDETALLSIDKIEQEIINSLEELGYSELRIRDTDVPCYYTMNSDGELYYVMEWEAFKAYTEDTGVTYIEAMAVKAE